MPICGHAASPSPAPGSHPSASCACGFASSGRWGDGGARDEVPCDWFLSLSIMVSVSV